MLRRWLPAAGLVLVTWAGVFWLPFQLAPRDRLVSASYVFGFNNALAVAALACLLALASVLRLARRAEPAAPASGPGPEQEPVPAWVLVAVGASHGVLTLAAAWYALRAANAALTWESRHFLHRIELLETYSLRPYLDFHVEYGPALLYPPVLLHRLLGSFGVSREAAYFSCHLLMNLAGLACLFALVRLAPAPRPLKAVAFALVGVAGFAPYMGLNGVVLRYALPYAAVLLGHRAVVRLREARSRLRLAGAFVTVLALLLANSLVSPEIALASALAWLAYSAFAARRAPWLPAVSLLAVAAAAALCRLTLPGGYYASPLRFSQGANNLPLLPAAHLLLYLMTLMLIVPPLLAAAWIGADDEAPLSGAFGALSMLTMAGALGRCDPPHVLFYGLAPSLLLLLRLGARSRAYFASYAAAYATVSIGLMQVANLVVFFGVPVRGFLDLAGTARSLAAQVRRDTAPRETSYLSALDKYPLVGVPYATYGGDSAAEARLFERRKLAPEYFVAAVGVYTSADVARKIEDVSRQEYLMVGAGWDKPWHLTSDTCRSHLKSLRQWFLYPARLECKAKDLDALAEINRFIATHYSPVERAGPIVVLRRNGSDSHEAGLPRRP